MKRPVLGSFPLVLCVLVSSALLVDLLSPSKECAPGAASANSLAVSNLPGQCDSWKESSFDGFREP